MKSFVPWSKPDIYYLRIQDNSHCVSKQHYQQALLPIICSSQKTAELLKEQTALLAFEVLFP